LRGPRARPRVFSRAASTEKQISRIILTLIHEEAIRLDPDFAEAWNEKGVTLAIHGKYDQAIRVLDEAIKLNHNFAGARYYKGLILNKLGRTAEAKTAFARAQELNS